MNNEQQQNNQVVGDSILNNILDSDKKTKVNKRSPQMSVQVRQCQETFNLLKYGINDDWTSNSEKQIYLPLPPNYIKSPIKLGHKEYLVLLLFLSGSEIIACNQGIQQRHVFSDKVQIARKLLLQDFDVSHKEQVLIMDNIIYTAGKELGISYIKGESLNASGVEIRQTVLAGQYIGIPYDKIGYILGSDEWTFATYLFVGYNYMSKGVFKHRYSVVDMWNACASILNLPAQIMTEEEKERKMKTVLQSLKRKKIITSRKYSEEGVGDKNSFAYKVNNNIDTCSMRFLNSKGRTWEQVSGEDMYISKSSNVRSFYLTMEQNRRLGNR